MPSGPEQGSPNTDKSNATRLWTGLRDAVSICLDGLDLIGEGLMPSLYDNATATHSAVGEAAKETPQPDEPKKSARRGTPPWVTHWCPYPPSVRSSPQHEVAIGGIPRSSVDMSARTPLHIDHDILHIAGDQLQASDYVGPQLSSVYDSNRFDKTLEEAYIASCAMEATPGLCEIPPATSSIQSFSNQAADGQDVVVSSDSRELAHLPLVEVLIPLVQWLQRLPTTPPEIHSDRGVEQMIDSPQTLSSHRPHEGTRTAHPGDQLLVQPRTGEVNEAPSSLAQAPERSPSTATISSDSSIITALSYHSQATTSCEDSQLSGRGSSSSVNSSSEDYNTWLNDSWSNSSGSSRSPSSTESALSPEVTVDALQTTPRPLGQERSGSGSTSLSGLSIITTFSSQSKVSAASEVSDGSSSGSSKSGSSPLSFGLNGTSQEWKPRTWKSQASIGIDNGSQGFVAETVSHAAGPPVFPTRTRRAGVDFVRRLRLRGPGKSPLEQFWSPPETQAKSSSSSMCSPAFD